MGTSQIQIGFKVLTKPLKIKANRQLVPPILDGDLNSIQTKIPHTNERNSIVTCK